MLSKRFVAWRIFHAAVFVPPFMCCEMSSQSRTRHKCFPTSVSVTDVVPDHSMCALDMMIEVRGSKERFVAVVVFAAEYPLIGM